MTLEQFLEKLEQTPRDWKLENGTNCICRYDSGGMRQCPISALCGRWMYQFPEAATELGLARDLAREIAMAADLMSNGDALLRAKIALLRAKLLRACGLA